MRRKTTALTNTTNTTGPALQKSPGVSLQKAFDYCEALTRSHYENFPVASLFIPRKQRAYISAIYAFARTADDFADEGALRPDDRLRRLDGWEEKLDNCFAGKADDPVFIALAETVSQMRIPKQPLADLLAAFRMDVRQSRFATFDDLLYYCKHSATPVGQLVLYVFGCPTTRNIGFSDNICTALQLANFWQDVSVDRKKGRVYIPLEDLERFGYTEHDLDRSVVDERFRELMRFEVERTKEIFAAGKPLLNEVTGTLGFELKLTWDGGMTILRKIGLQGYNVLGTRPKISTMDKVLIVLRAIAHRT